MASGIKTKIHLDVTQKVIAIKHDEIKNSVQGKDVKDNALNHNEKDLKEVADNV